MGEKSIIELLLEVKDPRRTNRMKYSMWLILVLQVLWIMSWRIWERAICRFIEDNEEDLIRELNLNVTSLPRRTTIKDALKQVDYEEVNDKFIQWSNWYIKIQDWEWVSCDGKVIKWTLDWENNHSHQNFVSLVSFLVWRTKQVLWSWKIETKKESEIPKVKELIQLLWIKWAILTLDALHCQRETVETIIKTWNDYVIWVKWNQPWLYEWIKKTFSVEKKR